MRKIQFRSSFKLFLNYLWDEPSSKVSQFANYHYLYVSSLFLEFYYVFQSDRNILICALKFMASLYL